MDAALAELLKQGLLGLLLVLSIFAIVSRDKSYREVQEKRIDESKANTERVLIALNANTEATKANADAIKLLASKG